MRIAVISITIAFCLSIGIANAQNISDEAVLTGDHINTKYYNGSIALTFARKEGRTVVKKVLLAKDSDPNSTVEREWLIMVYMSGVNDLGILGYLDLNLNAMESVNLTQKVTVVAYYNAMRTGENNDLQFQECPETRHIHHDSVTNKVTSPVIYTSSHDCNMGNWNQLTRFAIPNMKRFPAKKTLLIIWGHGEGHDGIAHDDVGGRGGSNISVKQLGSALSYITKTTGRKLDIIATDASSMQMTGIAYEIKDYAEVIVGSEESTPGQGFPYESILTDLNNNPEMNARGLSDVIVRNYGDYYSDKEISIASTRDSWKCKYSGGTTISSIDTASMPQFVELLNSWLSTITSDAENLNKISKMEISKNIFHFNSSKEPSMDLCDFISHALNVLPDGSKAKKAGRKLKNFITDSLIISQSGEGINMGTGWSYNERTCGLAIYMPKKWYSHIYSSSLFAIDSRWDDFIKDILTLWEKERNPASTIPINPE